MTFLDRLRPKPLWMHPDPETRSGAVRRLGSADREVLASIARSDADARIRRIALRKLDDPTVVAEVARTDADAGVREEAVALLLTVALESRDESAASAALEVLSEARDLAAVARSAALDPVRRAALARLSDPRLLAQVAKQAQDPATRLAALERVEEPALRGEVALKSEHKDAALAALDGLCDRVILEAVAARAKARSAARRARAMLEELPAEAPVVTPEDRRWKRLQLCLGLETLAPSRDWPRVADELARAKSGWGEGEADPELAQRFANACQALQDRLDEAAEERAEKERQDKAQAEAVEGRVSLCERLEALPGEADPAAVEEMRQAWASQPPLAGSDAAELDRRFAAAGDAWSGRRDAQLADRSRRAALEELCRVLEEAAEGEPVSEARSRFAEKRREWSALAEKPGPETADLEARVERAQARLAEREAKVREERTTRESANVERLKALCDRLESLAASASPSLRDADRGLREVKAALDDPGPLPSKRERESFGARLKAVRAALYPKLQELREADEWKRWANVAAQESLCRKAEALLAVEDLEEAARQLRSLEDEWNEVRQAPKAEGEALWQRFRTARDEVRARHQAHLASVAAELAENLKKKESLSEQAEALAESREWVKTAETLRGLQAHWKDIGPVPRQHAKAVWERFRKPCDRFFTRRHEDLVQRKAEWSRNLERKEALCEKVEALASSTDWEPTAAAIRGLRVEWKTIGPVKRSRSDAVWERFRSACDAFFERYRKRDELDRAATVAGREALCSELEALAPPPDAAEPPPPPDDLAARVQAAQARWRQAGPSPRDGAAVLEARFAAARDRLVAAHPESFRGSDLDPQANRLRMEKLCERVERLLPAESAGSPAEALAQRLRDALATNTIAGKGEVEARWRAATEEVEAARTAWKRLGPVPGEPGRELSERFRRACDRYFAQRPTRAR